MVRLGGFVEDNTQGYSGVEGGDSTGAAESSRLGFRASLRYTNHSFLRLISLEASWLAAQT